MIQVSCRASLVFSKLVDAPDEYAALQAVKSRIESAALQVALDLRRDGYALDLDVTYLVAYED